MNLLIENVNKSNKMLTPTKAKQKANTRERFGQEVMYLFIKHFVLTWTLSN